MVTRVSGLFWHRRGMRRPVRSWVRAPPAPPELARVNGRNIRIDKRRLHHANTIDNVREPMDASIVTALRLGSRPSVCAMPSPLASGPAVAEVPNRPASVGSRTPAPPPRLGRRGGSPPTTRCPGRSPGSGRLAGRSSCCLLTLGRASGLCYPSWHACGPERCHAAATALGCRPIPLESLARTGLRLRTSMA